MSVLAVNTPCSADPQPEPISVRQHVLAQIEGTNKSLAGACVKQNPTLGPVLENAFVNHRRRVTSILDALLETAEYESLADAEAPAKAIADAASSAASMSSITLTQRECDQIVGHLNGANDEDLRRTLDFMLAHINGLIWLQKQQDQ
jgi:hypothetical protein